MVDESIKVFIAEDNPEGSLFWLKFLANIRDASIEFIHIKQLYDIHKYLEKETPSVILLDLSNPRGKGLGDFLKVYNLVVNIPIIVIVGSDDPELGQQAVQEGAQDCLVKSEMSGYLLGHSIRYAISRYSHLKQLRLFSVVDELTGLFNRRGFLALAEQQVKMANRSERSLLLVFADLDGLKAINDRQGHQRGDLALIETAHVLKEAFPEAETMARLGGDEFVVLLSCRPELNVQTVLKRFRDALKEHNSYRRASVPLSVSIGVALYDPRRPCSVKELLEQADQFMYAQKKSKEHF